MMNITIKRRIFGLLLIVIGFGYVGETMNLWDFTIFIPGWWSFFLIIPAVFSMLEIGFRLWNIFLALLGVYFLADANGWVNYPLTFGFVVAVGLILLGIKIIFGTKGSTRYSLYEENHGDERNIRSNVYFGSKEFGRTGDIESLKVESIFANQVLDLSQANTRNIQFISLECVFGGIELIVDDSIHYILKKEVVFGNCKLMDTCTTGREVIIDASCVFGNIVIRCK